MEIECEPDRSLELVYLTILLLGDYTQPANCPTFTDPQVNVPADVRGARILELFSYLSILAG